MAAHQEIETLMGETPPPSRVPSAAQLRAWLGHIDVYWLDQLLKGRVPPGSRILDAGCGDGRNLAYLLAAGYRVAAVDRDPAAVEAVRELGRRLAPALPEDWARVAAIEALPFDTGVFDIVLSSAVLHFAADPSQFEAMVREMFRVLRGGGMFFARVASSIGMEGRVVPLGDGRYRLPDETARFLVDEGRLTGITARLGGRLLEPIRTVIVQDQRSMTTWCARKD